MILTDKICETCKYHLPDDEGFVICTNKKSKHKGEWTGNKDSCKKWETK